MFRRSVLAWIVNLCPLLRLSQSKALAEIVFGAMKCRRVSQADIGRSMETATTPKHNIKRVSRFVGNARVNIAEGCRGADASWWSWTGSTSAGSRSSRPQCRSEGGPGGLSPDVGPALTRRAVPILFAAYSKWRLKKSQNQFEEAFFELLSKLLPARTWTIVAADRAGTSAPLRGVPTCGASRGRNSRASSASSG